MYSYGPQHMAEQKQDVQLEHTYSSYVRIRDVALKTCQRRRTIGRSGEKGSGISVLVARHDIYIYGCVCVCWESLGVSDQHDNIVSFYVHFRTNTLREGHEPFYFNLYGLCSTKIFLQALNIPQRLICHLTNSQVSWGCRIYRLHLCKEVRTPQRVSWI